MKTEKKNHITEKPAKARRNTVGIVLTLLVTIGFIWAIFHLIAIDRPTKPITPDEMRENEIMAYRNLKRIAKAQQEYIEKDRNSDGLKTYAMFYVHLWRTVTPQGKPVPLGLIPKELGFAMDDTGPLDGYYYQDVHERQSTGNTTRPFDYSKEWSVAAIPGNRAKTGLLTLIIDHGGQIFATTHIHFQSLYPHEPSANGWTRIYSEDSLKAFQKTLDYRENL